MNPTEPMVRYWAQQLTFSVEQRPRVCVLCGATHHIQVHHRDRDWTNQDPRNRQVLCRLCHQKQHLTRPKRLTQVYGVRISFRQPRKGWGTPEYSRAPWLG